MRAVQELEENEEYVEREDEFDVCLAAGHSHKVHTQEDESAPVDVDTVHRVGPYSDSDVYARAPSPPLSCIHILMRTSK